MNNDSDPVPKRSPALEGRCEIFLSNPCRYPEVRARRLRPFIDPLIRELAPAAASLAVRFVSDREIRRLNATYRGHDEPTDVLSFPGDLAGSAAEPSRNPSCHHAERHMGDIAISVPTVRRQAREVGHGVERELCILMLHGVLHCLGYDHETDDGTMDRLEAELRRRHIDDV